MPYKVKKKPIQGSKDWAVVKTEKGSQKIVGRHKTKKAAKKHKRALYANVEDTEGD